MPELGGVALFRKLRENQITVPMILMTGHPMQDELTKLRSEGLTDWLLKPPSLKQLSQMIEKTLNENS